MSRKSENIDELFDRVTAAMRNEYPEQATVDEAARRVWARVAGEFEDAAPAVAAAPSEHIRGCADFQSLTPSFLKRELSPARQLLFEDHTQECLPCRRALQAARQVKTTAPDASPRAVNKARRPGATLLSRPAARWAIAAGLVLVCGLVMFPLLRRWTPFGGALEPVVQAVDGAVFVVDETRAEAVGVGRKIRRGERVRTAKEAGAVVSLPDGSLVEMRERSEFSVSENSAGTTLQLERGSVIVQAAKQRTGHLFVATEDCLVSVTGTVFSVNSGTKGARVSVIEGEVHVDHNGAKNVLHAGDQVATRSNLEPVPVRQEIAWSRDAERYAKMLAGIEELRRDLAARVPVPGVRYSTRFLEAMPEATAFYAALPNLSNTVVESYRVLQEQLARNEALREGWGHAGQDGGASANAKTQEVIEKIRRFGSYLGEEIAVGVGVNDNGRPGAPLVVAELKDAAGFKAALEEELQRAGGNDPAPLVFVADPLAAAEFAGGRALYLWVREDLFAASPRLEQLKALAVNLQSPAANAFRQSAFYARLADVYRDGAGLVVGADLQRILAHTLAERSPDAERRAKAMEQLGVTNLQHFILELKEQQGRGSNRAVVSFTEPGRGMASWLAAPGPMGALEFISPEANMVAAFVVKEPVALVDDLLGVLETIDPTLRQHLAKFESENSLNVRQDLAAPLGGEFAFAMDGPVLPAPSWKMIFEVNDAARLQQTFERLVERLNAQTPSGRGFQLEPSAGAGGRQFYTLRSNAFGLEVSYAYVNGYFIMTPNRALLDRALRYHDSGVTLPGSPKFTATLPSDGQANFSALLYHNLAPLVQPVAGQVAQAASSATGGDQQAMLASLGSMSPALAYAYAQGDQIVFAANTEQGAVGLNPASWLGATGSFGLRHVFDGAKRQPKAK